MTIKTAQPILDLKGTPLQTSEGEVLTIGAAIINALLLPYADEPGLPGDQKVKRFRLAERFMAEAVEITNQEAAEIELLVGKCYPPLVVGRVFKALERTTEEKRA